MSSRKRLAICCTCFLAILGLGLLWANAGTVDLNGGHRIGISLVFGLGAAIGLFFLFRQDAIIKETRQVVQKIHLASDQLATSIGHEIRTPLSGILGVIHLLKKTELDRNQQRYVDTASNSADMLLTIINDVLAHTRLDTGSFPIESESLDLTAVVEDVTSILAPEAIGKGLDLVSDIDPGIPYRIKGDALRLRQILNSFLSNAIKYTDSGVIAIYAVNSSGGVEIGVKDTGVGFEVERLQRLLHSSPRSVDEVDQEEIAQGLGLKSSHRLLEAMGSSLQFESEVGAGSRVFFELKIDAKLSSAYDWNPPQVLQDLRVAILSPLGVQRHSIRNVLTHWKIGQIQEVDFDADQNKELPELVPCNLLIIDQTESEMAVNEFIERLRNQSDWRETRFVHLVPQGRANEGGSADVRLYKPLSHSRLYTTVLEIVYKLAFNSEYGRQSELQNAPSGVFHGRRILLVEDNDISKMIALEMLEETGADVDVSINGAEAVEQAQQQRYDLILMDIQMPIMDGYEATRRIRALGGEFEMIPIIAITAHALDGDSVKSLDSGMNYHIAKPFEPDNLIEIIAGFIEQRSQD